MPPRHAYWTILVDDQPTAFRAHDAEELLPTLNRLKEKNPSAEMKWFERGKLYASRDQARDSGGGEGERRWEGPRPDRDDRGPTGDRSAPQASGDREGPRREGDRRDRNWRPGGEHKDPRQKYKDASKAKWDRFKKNIRDRSERGRAAAGATEGTPNPSRESDASGEPRDPDTLDPETFSPPHGDPLREHIDEHEETDGAEDQSEEPSDDHDQPELDQADGAPSRPHGDPMQRQARPGSEGSRSSAGRPRDRERSGGGGYQGNKPWGGDNRGSGDPSQPRATRDRGESRGGPPAREGGWRPPSGDRPYGDRPPRRDDNRGGYQNRERPGGGYQGNKPWGGDDRSGGSGGVRDRRSGGPSGPPDREAGPREDRGGSGGRPGYEGKKPWGGGAGSADRARKPWGPKAGGGKPWGAGPGNRPSTGGRPGGGKPFGPRGPSKRRDDE